MNNSIPRFDINIFRGMNNYKIISPKEYGEYLSKKNKKHGKIKKNKK